MKHCHIHLVLLILGGLLAFILSGCSSGMAPTNRDGITTEAVRYLYLSPFTDSASQTPRWMDIADNLFAAAFRSAYAYPANRVQLVFNDVGALSFQINAPNHALKPNFCYQMKIEGPTPWAGDTAADFVNSSLGHNGRWWDDTTNTPLTDADLVNGGHTGDQVKGYLYFDFIVSDRDGSVSATVPVKNSYHVTFKSTQTTRTANDGPLRSFSFTANRDGWAYDKRYGSTTVKLFGQWEPGRALPGKLALPKGTYAGVEFRLTEESFHSTDPNGGNWRTVMNAALPTFTVQ